MKTGRVTIPTDKNFVEGTKKIAKLWGADAVRDCDGTELPDNASELAPKVYKTYFLARGNNAWAYAHSETLQNVALISEFVLADKDVVAIDPLKGYFDEQLTLNEDENSLSRWQVIDRTSGKEVAWEYDKTTKRVIVKNAEYMHEYTVNFFAKVLWDATQIYNCTANNWTVDKDRDIDPVFPEAADLMESDLEKWLIENPQINVIRFTTFFYHFFLIHADKTKNMRQKYFDWFGYAMTASPTMFDIFEKTYGYKITIEDIVDGGYYANSFRTPTKTTLDYMNCVEKFVAQTVRRFTDIVHKHGRDAMMFWGDNWIGGEPYGDYFKDMGLDAVVGSVNSGLTMRMIAELPNLKYREARLHPYFFPDTMPEGRDEFVTEYRQNLWREERRALLRKCVDRIGFGGYLSIADKFPKFLAQVQKICDEFREIYDTLDGQKPYCSLKVAILNAWGKKRSWMTHMVCQDAPYQKILSSQGVLECLVGLPVDVDFISFDDVLNGALDSYDVVLHYGERDNAFVGAKYWENQEVVAKVRAFIYGGGGFIGMGQPSAVDKGGRFFQLAAALGVDEELSYSMFAPKYNYEKAKTHFILEDVTQDIDYGNALSNVYALEGTQILDIAEDKTLGLGTNAGHVRMAANTYGKGRCFYMTGIRYNYETARLLYRAMLWTAGKESELKKAFSSNVATECHYYPEKKKYAVANNTLEKQTTQFYDIDGNERTLTLQPLEIVWIGEL